MSTPSLVFSLESRLPRRDSTDEMHFVRKLGEVNTTENYFDIIVFNQSLEHIPDPMGALKNALTLHKEDGSLIISVPNFASNERHVFGMLWRHVDVPRHLYHFSPQTIGYIAHNLGLRFVNSRFKFWGGPWVAVSMARKEVGLKAFGLLAWHAIQQFLSLVMLNKARDGQMMTFVRSTSK